MADGTFEHLPKHPETDPSILQHRDVVAASRRSLRDAPSAVGSARPKQAGSGFKNALLNTVSGTTLAAAALASVPGAVEAIDYATRPMAAPPIATCSNLNTNVFNGLYHPPPKDRSQVKYYDVATSESPAPTNNQVVWDMVSQPATVNSVIIQALLNNGYSQDRARDSAGDQLGVVSRRTGIPVIATKNALSDTYRDSCAVRSDLINMNILRPGSDPSDPANYIEFKSIMAFEDKGSGSKGVAYYQPDTGVLTLHTTGRTRGENTDRAVAVIAGNTDYAVPFEFAERFMDEVAKQVKAQGLKVTATTLESHSLGANAGIAIKGVLESKHAYKQLFGDVTFTLLEGFGESQAAEATARHYDLPMDKLVKNTYSIRSGDENTANVIGAETRFNHTIGKTYQIDFFLTDDDRRARDIQLGTHDLTVLTQCLSQGYAEIRPFSGKFGSSGDAYWQDKAFEIVGGWAKTVRNVRGVVEGYEGKVSIPSSNDIKAMGPGR